MTFPVHIACVSIPFFTLLFACSRYKTQSTKISSSHASITHAIVTIYLSGELLRRYFMDNNFDRELTATMSGISFGYYMMDFVSLAVSKEYNWKQRCAYFTHHILALVMIYIISIPVQVFPVVRYHIECELVILALITTEVSSLFANFHEQISHYAKTNYRLRFINGLCMLFTFVITRFIFVPVAYYMDRACIFDSVESSRFVNMIVIPFTLLNSYWLNAIIKGTLKALKEKKY